jgi:eukaryotic-like serine/threonine-protein kinase
LKADGIPRWGYYRVRAEKEGFAPVIQTFFPVAGLSMELTMQPASTVPPGMVWVPAGENLFPTPPLPLPGFWMDAYEVSNREFKKFVDAGGYQKPEYWKEPIFKDGKRLSWQQAMEELRDSTRRPGPASWQFGTYPDGAAAMPVGGVSWYEAAAYAEFAGKNLPTAYEWYLASGYPTPNSEIVRMSNFGGKGPAETGTRRGMAPFGTYDMAGNLNEWTASAGDGRLHYILGGAWDQEPYEFGAALLKEPLTRAATIGFRCIRRVTAPPLQSLGPVHLEAPPTRAKPVDDSTYSIFSRLQAYDKTRLETKIEEVEDSSPYWRRETVTFPAAYGSERMMLHLFLPKNSTPPYQLVAVFGGSNVFYTTRMQDFQFPYEFLLRSGRAVVFPVFSGTLERGPSPFILPVNQERERGLRWPKDMGQTIDYLETRPDIDAKSLGFYGLSYGATHGVRLLALDRRFKAAVFSSGGLFPNQPPETDAWNYAPRVRTPVLMLNGRDDFYTPVESAQMPLFNSLGTPAADKHYVQYDGGHANLVSRPELIGQILEWFDHYLGPVQLRP